MASDFLRKGHVESEPFCTINSHLLLPVILYSKSHFLYKHSHFLHKAYVVSKSFLYYKQSFSAEKTCTISHCRLGPAVALFHGKSHNKTQDGVLSEKTTSRANKRGRWRQGEEERERARARGRDETREKDRHKHNVMKRVRNRETQGQKSTK